MILPVATGAALVAALVDPAWAPAVNTALLLLVLRVQTNAKRQAASEHSETLRSRNTRR